MMLRCNDHPSTKLILMMGRWWGTNDHSWDVWIGNGWDSRVVCHRNGPLVKTLVILDFGVFLSWTVSHQFWMFLKQLTNVGYEACLFIVVDHKVSIKTWSVEGMREIKLHSSYNLSQSPRSSNSIDLPTLLGIVQALQGALKDGWQNPQNFKTQSCVLYLSQP